MAKPRRIAVVFPVGYLETVPNVYNFIVMLAKNGFVVDVFILPGAGTIFPEVDFSETNVLLHRLPHPGNWMPWPLRHAWRSLVFPVWAFRICLKRRPSLFIGVDPYGLVTAALLGSLYRRPWVYFSLELMHSLNPATSSRIKALEKWCSRRSALIIIQDQMRARLMAEDNDIPMTQFGFLPNSPLGPAQRRKSRLLHDKYGFTEADRVLLYAGGLWEGVAEIAEAARRFPDDWKMVFQTRWNYQDLSRYFGELLKLPNLFVSDTAVPMSQLDDLVASADIGIAFYGVSEANLNVYYVGKSSGKLCQYLHCGLPVIVERLPGWEEMVDRYHSGIAVDSVAEIPEAAARILDDYERFSKGAVEHFQRELCFESAFAQVASRLEMLLSQ